MHGNNGRAHQPNNCAEGDEAHMADIVLQYPEGLLHELEWQGRRGRDGMLHQWELQEQWWFEPEPYAQCLVSHGRRERNSLEWLAGLR